ncbi:Golgi transport complex subunit 5-domain-containing protein [Hyaloraphidium curvatum]|nr:Golgi transport complex subunit 5-domain-containing protein [Hyaloraphidium curvatum]
MSDSDAADDVSVDGAAEAPASAAPLKAPAPNTPAAILAHPDYADFAADGFDANAYASEIVHSPASAYYSGSGGISASLQKLAYNVEFLRKQIHDQVAAHYEDLLQQVTGLQDLEGHLFSVRQGLASLDGTMDKIRAKVRAPHTQLSQLTLQLERVQLAAEVLRRVIRFLYLSRRLEAQMAAHAAAEGREGGERELAKAALTYSEIESILEGSDLAGIDAVSRLLPHLATSRASIVRVGDAHLRRGMQTGDQSALAYGLQVHRNLAQLPRTVKAAADALLEECSERVRGGLDVQAANKDARDGTGGAGSQPAVRRAGGNEPVASAQAAVWASALWTRLEKAVDGVYGAVAEAYLLERVLRRRKDPISGATFEEEVLPAFGGEGVVEYVWRNLAANFDREIKNATKSSVFLLQTLQNAYPRLLRLVKDFFVRVRVIKGAFNDPTAPQPPAPDPLPLTPGASSASLPDDPTDPHELLFLRSLSPLATAYIQRSATRMFDPINLAFPGERAARWVPAREDSERIVRVVAAELEQARFDAKLLRSVGRNAGKAAHAFAVKAEGLVSAYDLAPVMAGPAAPGLVTDLELVNALFWFEDGVWRVLEEYEVASGLVEEMGPALEAVRKVAMAAVEPLFRNMGKELEATIVKIHKEDYHKSAPAKAAGVVRVGTPSTDADGQYLKELGTRLKWIQKEVVARLTAPGDESRSWVRALAARVLDLFLRHASLCRPLSEPGKLRLANDMTQVEFLLNQFLVDSGIKNGLNAASTDPTDELVSAYRHLRAFRPLLFLDLQQLVAPHHTSQIQTLIVVHHLFVRSPAGTLLLPHERFGWNQQQYSEWLDSHPEKDQITLAERCLEEYVNDVRRKGEKEFVAEFPVVRTVLDEWKARLAGER